MGGAVSSGRDNNELIDNLMSGNYIRTRQVEEVFRALDRADYMTPEARDQAYKDLAWRNGPLHLSSPCIYSEVMEGLELRPGLSFLNVGSGTGYLSSLVGLILGTAGINHGVEVHPAVVEYATKKISQFIENSPTLDEFDFCEPKYYHGNGLCLSPPESGYDRVYCGAACPMEYEMYFKQLIKVGGVLVMPLNDTLLQVRRVAPDKWVSRSLLNVSFATLRVPAADEATPQVKLEALRPVRLQLLSRAVVRSCMRGGVLRRHPELRRGQRAAPPAACPRRICIPIEPGGSVEGLNVLHDLDGDSGANEMNALLSLVISMGRNQAAESLRFDRVDSESSDDDNGAESSESERGEHGLGEPAKQRPGDIDLPVSDSEDKSDPSAKGHSGGAPGAPRPRRIDDPKHRSGQSGDDRSPYGTAMREFLRKRSDVRPSTSQTKGGVVEALTSAEKEAVVRNEERTDNVTGPPKRELPGVPSVVEIDLGEESDMKGDAEDLVDPDAGDFEVLKNGPKRQKLAGGGAEAEGPAAAGGGGWAPGAEELAHAARRRRREALGGAARRVRLWLLMKQAVRELPLPPALKKFVNLGRCFQF